MSQVNDHNSGFNKSARDIIKARRIIKQRIDFIISLANYSHSSDDGEMPLIYEKKGQVCLKTILMIES